MAEVREQIRGFILHNFLFTDDQARLKDAESLLGLGVIDSTGVLEMVSFLEREFGFALPDEDMTPENMDSVDALCRLVERMRAAA